MKEKRTSKGWKEKEGKWTRADTHCDFLFVFGWLGICFVFHCCPLSVGFAFVDAAHDGWALRVACGKGHVETMDRLLALGADPHIGEEGGAAGRRAGTALMLAVLSGNPMAVRCMLDDGRHRIDAQDRVDGFTALHWAAGGRVTTMDSARSRTAIIRLLLAAGANPCIKDHQSRTGTALMLAVLSGNPMAVRCLLDDGRHRIDAQDRVDGFTALHWAAGGRVTTMDSARSRTAIIRLLLAAGANPCIKDHQSRTPAMYARQRIRGRTPDFVDILEREAAEPERAHHLHKLRRLHDARHVIGKAKRAARTRRDRQTKPVAAAPPFLRARVARGEELPAVNAVGKDKELLAVAAHALRRAGMDEGLPEDLWYELMDMLLPAWDPERRRP